MGTAHAGGDVISQHNYPPLAIPSATDDLLRTLFLPASEAFGAHLARISNDYFTNKDKGNIQSHVDAVKSEGVEFNAAEVSGQQKTKLLEWTEGASHVDPQKNEFEAAAWRAVLDDIMRDNSYDSVAIVKQLTRDDLELLIEAYDGHRVFYAPPILRNLSLLEYGYARSDTGMWFRLFVLVLLPFIIIASMNFALDLIYPGVALMPDKNFESSPLLRQALYAIKNNQLVVYLMLIATYSPVLFSQIRRLLAARPTRRGAHIARKIKTYLDQPPSPAADRTAA